jgi:hypothetical protein
MYINHMHNIDGFVCTFDFWCPSIATKEEINTIIDATC